MKLTASLWISVALLVTSPALADGDSAHGRVLFGRWVACHSLDAGKNLVGPSQTLPGTKMLVGVQNAMDRADIIAFLKAGP